MALRLQQGRENSVLREISVPVKSLDKNIKKLMKNMLADLKADKNAVGLAAPQVGHNIRLIVAYLHEKCIVMINPEISEISEETNIDEEGCLSIPGEFGKVTRPSHITVEFFNEKLQKKKFNLSLFDARIILHEVDHLDGILFVDRMTEEQLAEMETAKKKETGS